MAVSKQEQQFIHNEVYGATPTDLEEMHAITIETLQTLQLKRSLQGSLSVADDKEFDLCIEALAKIETRQSNGGWWFCTKRRMQLVVKYMK